mgnify:CR=1 FL=1
MSIDTDPDSWQDIDSWWSTLIHTSKPAAFELVIDLEPDKIASHWESIDPWWDTYVEAQQETIDSLLDELAEVQQEWVDSDSMFDKNPLEVDWRTGSPEAGPLRVNQEENWSQWLAHLIRSGPDSIRKTLFGSSFDQDPQSVRREVYLSDTDGRDRRVDILVFYDDVGVSIEVKKGDEHYEKTPHTASLIESEYPGIDWSHFLLVQENKSEKVEQSFDEVEQVDENKVIRTSVSNDISLLYWKDVSQALRTTLLRESNSTHHWESSAYLFCTLIEQKLLGLLPVPTVKRLDDAHDVRVSEGIIFSGGDVESQIIYLRGAQDILQR